jgi:hypothetical protein
VQDLMGALPYEKFALPWPRIRTDYIASHQNLQTFNPFLFCRVPSCNCSYMRTSIGSSQPSTRASCHHFPALDTLVVAHTAPYLLPTPID